MPTTSRTRQPERDEPQIARTDDAPAQGVAELDGAALDRVDRGVAGSMLLGMQQTRGNAYVSRMVASGQPLARRKAPTAEESVGASPGTAHFVEDTTTKDPGDTLAVGESGFTFQMLKEVPQAAGKTFAYYRDAHLKTVKPDFSFLDDKQMPYVSKRLVKAQDELDAAEGKGWTEFRTIPSVIRLKKEERDRWEKVGATLAKDRALEDELVQHHNASVPRANHMYASLARLEAMQEMLGVKSPKEMSDALIKSLGEAEPIAEGLAAKQGALPLMKASEAVSGAAKRSTQAQKDMQAAWRETQEFLLKDHAGEIRKKGEKDEKRLAKINETIQAAKAVGGVIDLSMAVMSGGATMVEGVSTKLKPSQLADLAAEDEPDVRDKSAVAGAKKVGGAITKAMGIEIPTSASGLLETAAKIYYWSELEEIRKRLAALSAQAGWHESEAKEIGIKAKFEAFEAKVAAFQLANEELQKYVFDRQRAYLQLGQKLDEAAARNPAYKSSAPGKGKERFATVMTLVSAVREVLAVGREAKTSFRNTDELREKLAMIAEHREPLRGLPRGEAEPLKKMLGQQMGFEGNLELLLTELGPIDAAAGQLMTKATGGEEGAAY